MPRFLTRSCCALAPLIVLGCAHAGRRFSLADPIWQDHDMTPFAARPAEIYTPPQWDRVEHTLFRPLSEALLYRLDTEAANVNALDEVPDSSWFTNRIGHVEITPAQLRAGACSSAEDPPRPWTVVRVKTSGTSPGLVIRAADGQTSIFKIDFDAPERGTAADSISTRIFWGAGYFTPCNRVILFEHEELVLAAEPDGDHELPTQGDVDALLEAAGRAPDGRLRASLSEYLPGRPLVGWRFDGLRDDDPNDVFPHEDRREVRGMWALSAWLNHIDTRAENNMDVWIERGDRGYLRAWMARIIAAFTEAHLRAAIDSGRFSQPLTRRELLRILLERRRRILERYLTRLSPLAHPGVVGRTLCLTDLAITSGLRSPTARRYVAQAWRDWPTGEERSGVESSADAGRVCLELPPAEGHGFPRYQVVDVVASTAGRERSGPARVHLYQLGASEYRLVGLERPEP